MKKKKIIDFHMKLTEIKIPGNLNKNDLLCTKIYKKFVEMLGKFKEIKSTSNYICVGNRKMDQFQEVPPFRRSKLEVVEMSKNQLLNKYPVFYIFLF